MAQKDIILRIKTEGAEASEATIKDLTKEIGRLEKELKEAERGSERFAAAQKRLGQVQKTLKTQGGKYQAQLTRVDTIQKKAAKSSNEAAGGVSNMGKSLGMARAAGAAFIALGLVSQIQQLGKQAVLAAGEYESLSIAFSTFLGGADKAKLVLEELNRFSVETPFTPEQVNLAARALLGQGVTIGNTTRLLRNLGNVSAAVNTNFNELVDIVARARSQGRLFQEDINQFTGRGIPILGELAKVLGKTEGELRKAVMNGQVTFETLDKALQNLTSETGRFGGLIEKQSKTLPGLLSTLEGAWDNLLRKLGEGKPLEVAKDGINGLIAGVKSLTETIDPGAKAVSAAVKEIKRELSLEGISGLTKEQLAQRSEQLRQSLFEEQELLKASQASAKATLDDANRIQISLTESTSKAAKKRRQKTGLEERAESFALQARIQQARVSAIKNALDDIAKIEDKARKDAASKEASLLPDRLKLEIFKIELANEAARRLAELNIKRGIDNKAVTDTIKANEERLYALRLRLANLSAKNDAQRELNRLKARDTANKAIEKADTQYQKSLEGVSEALQKSRKSASEYADELLNVKTATEGAASSSDFFKDNLSDLLRNTQDLAEATDFGTGAIDEQEVKWATLFDSIKDFSGDLVKEVLPEVLDVFEQINARQAQSLDTSISLQEKRVSQARELADKGNAEALQREREQLNAQLAQREEVARRADRLAKIRTKTEIGLAAARAAASSGLPVAGQLAAAAAVAFGLPAIINAIPVFEDGGAVGGKPHSQGGTVIEAEKGEFVVNKKSYSAFSPAVDAINSRTVSPALMNAAATGNLSTSFAMHTKPLEDRLKSVERAIYAIPQTAFSLDERGLTKLISSIQRRDLRV